VAILTLAQFKASGTYLLNTAKFPTDAITSQLILDSEDSYLGVRGKPFKKITGDITSGSAEITGIAGYDLLGLKKGQRLVGTGISGEIIDITTDGTTVTIDANASATTENLEMFVYPEQSLAVAIQIVNYLRQDYVDNYLTKSESIEKHSWTNWGTMDMKSGLPRKITSRIKSLAHLKEGQKTGQGYLKGRDEISVDDIDTQVGLGDVTVTQ